MFAKLYFSIHMEDYRQIPTHPLKQNGCQITQCIALIISRALVSTRRPKTSNFTSTRIRCITYTALMLKFANFLEIAVSENISMSHALNQ